MSDALPGIVAFLSDFGLQDGYVGEVHGVIAGKRGVRVVDLCHLVPPGDVRTGAFLLMRGRSAFPVLSVFLGVVDPGVGTSRRPVAVQDSRGFLVGPDNGLLSWAAESGSIWRAIDPSHRSTDSRSRTFDGKDLFGPVAAGLASGVLSFDDVGPVIGDPVRLPFPSWSRRGRTWHGEVLHVDRFGNVLTSIPTEAWSQVMADASLLEIRCRGAIHPATVGVYQESRGLTVHGDSSGFLEVALNRASAAEMMGVRPGDGLEVAG